jgi:hypothetical protein
MNTERTFEHLTLSQLPLFYLGIVAFSAVSSFLIALYMRRGGIEILNGRLIGLNYWGFKKDIPVFKISRLYTYSSNGIDAVVADAGSNGEIHISTYTENLDELLQYIEQHMNGRDA